MKVWMLWSHYYDFCNEWESLIGIYDSEEKAIYAQIKEEEEEKYKRKDHDWTSIREDIVN